MRGSLLSAALLVACVAEPSSVQRALSGGSEGSGRWHHAEVPDVGVGVYEPESKLDLPKAEGCDQLDLLFVVDNSGSMKDEQASLFEALPGFIDNMRDLNVGFDMHIGVVTTDGYRLNPQGCQSIGALVTKSGENRCGPYSTGARYMSPEDLDSGAFECAFLVGDEGSQFERPSEALRAAVMPVHEEGDAPFGVRFDECNVGFRRPQAAFVAVILTDEDDNSDGNAQQWAMELDYLVGDVETLYVGFIGDEELDCGLNPPTKLRSFFTKVPSYVASICSDYASELENATLELAAQCGAGPKEG